MPDGLQLGPASCSSQHHGSVSAGPCQRLEVRGQEQLLERDPERAPQLRSRGPSREGLGRGECKGVGVGQRILGQPLPWPSSPHPSAILFPLVSEDLLPPD